ncbi:MAG: CDP-diacylglycerol--glycerol-3-phosphate 3-phosphatidyltransferase [Deltaproteobacteria bacterium]|nr:CDP-diacylglycerol--glycerol-3-phosphate 3-phosphatidyltransferase [Deltaproteobacteria bacterium]
MPRGAFYNVPNVISIARVLLVPVIVLLLMSIHPEDASQTAWNVAASFYAALLFGVGAVSDIVDGFLARRHQQITIFGKLFDPLADKLLTFGALVMLIPLHRMSAWVVVLLLAREIGVTTLRSIASGEGMVITAGKWGKMKNAFNNCGVPFIMLYYPHFGVEWYYAGWILFLISVVLALVSGYQYGQIFFQELTARGAKG